MVNTNVADLYGSCKHVDVWIGFLANATSLDLIQRSEVRKVQTSFGLDGLIAFRCHVGFEAFFLLACTLRRVLIKLLHN
jgi:hypothetical protein